MARVPEREVAGDTTPVIFSTSFDFLIFCLSWGEPPSRLRKHPLSCGPGHLPSFQPVARGWPQPWHSRCVPSTASSSHCVPTTRDVYMNETQTLPWGDSLSGVGEGRWAAGRQASETKWKVLRSREGLWWHCRGDGTRVAAWVKGSCDVEGERQGGHGTEASSFILPKTHKQIKAPA